MEAEYVLWDGQSEIGKVQVSRRGLYYRFVCRCRISGELIYRLMVKCGDTYISAGVLVPVEDGFGLDKKIPVKKFDGEDFVFSIRPYHGTSLDGFYPICPEEPFAYLERLGCAYLTTRQGKCYIGFREA